MSKKQALRAAAFCLLAALMLASLTWLLRDRETTLSSFYSEPRDTVDVFIVGSSHVNSAYIPGVLWKEYGISAHNVFSWSQPIWISYHYIKEGLKTQTPAVVVLDLNGLMYGNSNEQPQQTDENNYLNSFSIDPGWNLLEMCQTVAACGIDLRDPVEFWPLVHYHTRWKVLDRDAFTYNPHKDHSYLKGYGFQVLVTPNEKPPVEAPAQSQPPYETAEAYLEKIVQLSRREGFQLILTLTPYRWQPNEPAIYRWIEEYAAANGLPFYNYNGADGERVGIDWEEDFCDISHVNYKGALKLTRDLGEQLLLCEGADLRAPEEFPNKTQLDEDAAMMCRTIDLWEALQKPSTETLPWLAGHGVLLAAAAPGGTALCREAADALRAIGWNEAPISPADTGSYVAVCSPNGAEEQADPAGAACALQAAGVTARSEDGTVSFAAGSVDYAAHVPGIQLLYYDDVLQRVTYRATVDAEGRFVYEDVSSIGRGGA